MRHVIIGASAAGLAAARELRRLDPKAEITVISRDASVYSRCMLHLNLSGGRDFSRMSFVPDDFFETNRITWLRGESVEAVEVDLNALRIASGMRISYDDLLIASGASSVVPPIPNLRRRDNVFTFRNLEDVRSLALWGQPGTRAVVIGGGLVGLDVAVGLMELGVAVTILEVAPRILTMQLDDYAAGRYARLLEQHGATVITGAKVAEAVLDDEDAVEAIALESGQCLWCDFVVVAAGVAPNTGFIKDNRTELTEGKRAIVIDWQCRTSVPNIYAAGDVTFLAPIWPEAVRQGEVAASNMAGFERSLPECVFSLTNSMNFFGLPTVSYGKTTATDPAVCEEVYRDGDVYKKILHKNGVITGAIFQGDIDNCGMYLRLVRDQVKVNRTGKPLLKLSYADFFEQLPNGEFR